jgi:ATP-binding cassette subfamily C protein PrsD
MGMMPPMAGRWNKLAGRLGMLQRNSSDALAFYSITTKSFRYFLQSAVLAMGAYLVINGEITAGLMIAASIAAARALAPIEQVVGHWQGFVAFRQAAQRVRAVLTASGQGRSGRTELPLPARDLIVANLATAPGLERAPLARGVSFSLQAGEAVGIVGLSGSGKSSVARALVGVWPIIQGDVRLDGSELEHFEPERLGAAIGYLPQAVELFDGTVAENIARFSPGDTTSDMLRAARAAGVHDLIAKLADGYDTRIGESGAMLSAGQRQRIGLARALFRDPFLIVLDEPNSNLDAEGDAALNEAVLSAKRRGAVIAIIAHRPSAIAMADKLLFMQDGRQAAFGEKQDVLRRISQNEPSKRHDRIEGHLDTRVYAAHG